MKKIKFSIIALVILSIYTVVSCESNTYEEIKGSNSANPTYLTDVKPIFDSNCVSCHSTGAQSPALDNYNSAKIATLNGNVVCRIDDQSCGSVMPQSGRMPQTTIDVIKLWKQQGCN